MSAGHRPTAQVVNLITALAKGDRWWTPVELADQLGLHRDTVRAILDELRDADWVETLRDGELFRLGVALPALGLNHQTKLAARLARLERDVRVLRGGDCDSD